MGLSDPLWFLLPLIPKHLLTGPPLDGLFSFRPFSNLLLIPKSCLSVVFCLLSFCLLFSVLFSFSLLSVSCLLLFLFFLYCSCFLPLCLNFVCIFSFLMPCLSFGLTYSLLLFYILMISVSWLLRLNFF